MAKKVIKPKAYDLGCGGYQLFYKCGKCEYCFNMAHNGFDYCPHCGNKIDWGVVIEVNEEWKQKYLNSDPEGKKKMREFIDKANLYITDGERRAMEKTEATKKAIIKSNIRYYLGQGWTKEELIAKGFFTESDFSNY